MLLKTSMNYWRIPLVVTDPGISYRSEVTTKTRDGRLVAEALPKPVPPPADPALWLAEHLMYAVGLPVPADLILVKDLATNQPPTFEELRTQRALLFDFDLLIDKFKSIGRPVIDYTLLNRASIRDWVVLQNRTFIDEVNGFPSVAVGHPRAVGSSVSSETISFHFLRGGSSDREAFLQSVGATPKGGFPPVTLEGPDATKRLGFLWTTDPKLRPSFAFDNTRFVTWLMNSTYGRANARIFTRLSLQLPAPPTGELKSFFGIPVQPVAGRNAVQLAIPPLDPKAVLDQTSTTFCHELSHGFYLGDEYNEHDTPSALTEQELDETPNLSTAALVVTADKSVAIDKIKWNWQRIRRASIFKSKITQPTPGEFHVYLGRARALQFDRTMKLMIRQRKRLQIIGRDPVISKTVFTVKSVHANNPDNDQDTVSSTVVMLGDPATPLQDFEDGGLLFQPVDAPSTVTPARPFLTLVPPAAERVMKAIGGTMSGKDCDNSFAGIMPTPEKEDPDGKVSQKNLTRLVGVYFGGHTLACGIVHPVGMCMMRNSGHRPDKPEEGEPPPTPESLRGISGLCAVCRFALVDIIDPEHHFQNDLDYEKWYPF